MERGKEHVLRLNHFAHSVDRKSGTFDAREPIEQITAICQRLATLKKVELLSQLGQQPAEIRGDRFELEHLVFQCIDIALSVSAHGSLISLELEKAEGGARIMLGGRSLDDASRHSPAKLELARRLAARMGGKLEARFDPGSGLQLVVELPGATPV